MTTPSFAVETGIPGMIFERSVPVTMTDGLELRINIYRPDRPGRFPVIMLHGPYGKDTRDADAPPFRDGWRHLIATYPELLAKSSGRFIRWEAPDPERWIPDDYIIIHADSRGSGASPGMLDPFSPRQTEDFATLITWASRQPWSSGKVGLLGTSYYAISQWQVAARQPEGLAALLPWEGAFDHYREIAHEGLIPSMYWEGWFQRQLVINQNGNGDTPYVDAVTGEKTTGKALSPQLLELNRVAPAAAHRRQIFDGAYYRERTADPQRIEVPFLCVGNWGGWSIEGYLRAASAAKWLRIQTGDHHTPFYSEESLALQKRFFDHFLKGESNGWESEPRVSVAVRRPDSVAWRAESAWPLSGTEWDRYLLDAADGSMGPGKTSAAAAEVSFSATDGEAIFTTAPFAEETEFTGPVKLKLWVRSTTADMDIFATVRLLDPSGREVTFGAYTAATAANAPVSRGSLRVSHRALDPEQSTELRPYHSHLAAEAMTPGQLYETDVEIWRTSVVVPEGHRLSLTVQGHPAFPSNPADRDPELFDGTNAVATGAGQSSYLLLPRIPRTRSES